MGNGTRVVVSEMAGRSTLAMKAAELGLELDGEVIGRVLDELKRLEHEGYHFEVADGSLELLLRRATGWAADYFTVESFRVITDHGERNDVQATASATASSVLGVTTEATVKVHVGSERIVAVAEGNGPVNALDGALRGAIGAKFPALDHIHLTDYRVRVLDTGRGTGAVTRVLVDTTDGSGPGPPSGCRRTSLRPAGKPSTIRSSSGCSTPPSGGAGRPLSARGDHRGVAHDRVEPHRSVVGRASPAADHRRLGRARPGGQDARRRRPPGRPLVSRRSQSGGPPTVLIRTPYGRRIIGPLGRLYAERGYQVVIQSCRGTFGSEGEWDPVRNEQADGRATLEWVPPSRGSTAASSCGVPATSA